MTPGIAAKENPMCPRGEIPWVRHYDEAGTPRYLVTSDKRRERYFLYKVIGEKLERIAKAKTPVAFNSKIKL